MTCAFVSFVGGIVSVSLLEYAKPFSFLKYNDVCRYLVVFSIVPILFGYIKCCRIVEGAFSIFWKLLVFVLQMIIGIGLGVGGAFAVEKLEGSCVMWGTLTLLVTISSMEIYLMVEKYTLLVDTVFTVLLGVLCLKYEPKWHIVFLMAVYFSRGAALFTLKQKFMKEKKAEEELQRTTLIDLVYDIEDQFEHATGGVEFPQPQQIDVDTLHQLGNSK